MLRRAPFVVVLLSCTPAPPPPAAVAPEAAAPAAPSGLAAVSAPAVAPPPPAPSATPAEAPPPPPQVKVATIGMHVGGGPFDEPTKEPFKRAVEPRFPDLARCWSHVTNPHELDVGVDLVIDANGGRPHVSHPRTLAEGAAFVPCVIAFFESVDFGKPKNGKTVLSYSVRFKP